MNAHPVSDYDPRIEAALVELRALIARRYPDAIFDVAHGEDPEGVYLTAYVDVDDTDEVVDLFVERLLALQIEDGLSVYVIPLRADSRRQAPAPQSH